MNRSIMVPTTLFVLYLVILGAAYLFESAKVELVYLIDVIFWNGGAKYLGVYILLPIIILVPFFLKGSNGLFSVIETCCFSYIFSQAAIMVFLCAFYSEMDFVHVLGFLADIIIALVCGKLIFDFSKNLSPGIVSLCVFLAVSLAWVPHIDFLIYSLPSHKIF